MLQQNNHQSASCRSLRLGTVVTAIGLAISVSLLCLQASTESFHRFRGQRHLLDEELQQESPHSSRGLLLNFFGDLFGLQEAAYKRKVPELYNAIPNPPQHSKAVVIGSGFGGAVAAYRLALAGVQVTVLERGQDWPIDLFREIHSPEATRDGRAFWRRTSARAPIVAAQGLQLPVDRYGGVLDITEYENIEIWRAACVGGGSKVFTGAMVEPFKQEYFEAIFKNTSVTWSEMQEKYFPRVKQMLNLSPVPDDVLASNPFSHRRVWEQQARNAGYNVFRPLSIFNWDVVRKELSRQSRVSATIGESNYGNSNGAKFDVTQNYLKKAIETGNVKIFPNQLVKDIRKTSNGFTVDIEKLSPRSDVLERYSISADNVFLAAGSVGTTELLVKAKAKGTIDLRNNNEIGRGWGSNGDAILSRSFSPITGLTQSSPCSSGIHDDSGQVPATV